MAYNHGKEERKWRLWKEAEEKILRAYGVDENIIEEIRIYDRAEFNSDRRFYRRLNDMEEYIEKVDLFVITYKTAKTLDFTGIPAHSSNKLSAHLLSDHI